MIKAVIKYHEKEETHNVTAETDDYDKALDHMSTMVRDNKSMKLIGVKNPNPPEQ